MSLSFMRGAPINGDRGDRVKDDCIKFATPP